MFSGLIGILGGVTLGVHLITRTNPNPIAASRRSPTLAGAAVATATTAIVVFSGGTPEPFIYFQF